MNKLISRIQGKIGDSNLLNRINENLSGSELHSFLMELFRRRSKSIHTPQLLNDFHFNRFVWPATTDTIAMKELELECLRKSQEADFVPLSLSPVTPLGTCSAMALVDQNNVLTSLRGTEVVSDVTNVLALQVAHAIKYSHTPLAHISKFACVHRHVRCQYFDHPDYSAHFSVLGLGSGGRDRGDYGFEIDQVQSHLQLMLDLIKSLSDPEQQFVVRFFIEKESSGFREKFNKSIDYLKGRVKYEFVDDLENNYYKTIRFMISTEVNGQELDVADGGIVDWTQKLLSDRKQRMCTSAIGLELFYKLISGTLTGYQLGDK